MVRVKICGVTTPADAEYAARCGADAVGLNFYPRSPRCLTPGQALAILRALPAFVDPVGLFVNEPPEAMLTAARPLGLRTIQVHGDHLPDSWPDPNGRFVPAFAVRDATSLRALDAYLERCRARDALPAAVLVDAHVPGAYGGTGQLAPWHLLADYRPPVPLILAGGLTAENVAEAVRRVRPYAVDVASGVESAPGRKDPEKVRRFIDAARSV